jgi:two-component system chemotaxis response regulator CheB
LDVLIRLFLDCEMRILLAFQSSSEGRRIQQALQKNPKSKIISMARDLTEVYTVSEQKKPHVVFISVRLAMCREFEVLNLLFRALSIFCVVVRDDGVATEAENIFFRRYQVTLVSADECGDFEMKMPEVVSSTAFVQFLQKRRGVSDVFDQGFILIGASTGGVDALLKLLGTFPEKCPPTVIVQHTGERFVPGLAALIDGRVEPSVSVAASGSCLKHGLVLFAPGGDFHLVLRGRDPVSCQLSNRAAGTGHCPSVDQLFLSAVPYGSKVAAALLTGMGRDGAEGLLALSNAGAVTIGQDENSSVVYGMPRIAYEMGAVQKQLPIDQIGLALLDARRARS